MAVTEIPFPRPAELLRRSSWQDLNETRVANRIRPWDGEELLDVELLMSPIARGAIKHVATHLAPNAPRMVWPFFTTYSIDYDVDIAGLRVWSPESRRAIADEGARLLSFVAADAQDHDVRIVTPG